MSQGKSYPESRLPSTEGRVVYAVHTPFLGDTPGTRTPGHTAALIGRRAADAEASACAQQVTLDDLNERQRGRSWQLPVDVEQQNALPVWTSRACWQNQLRLQLSSSRGRRFCRRRHVAPMKVLAVGTMMAGRADRSSGRNCTAGNRLLARHAGVSEDVVTRARQVLADLGFAVELVRGRRLDAAERDAARAHHNGYQAVAASVWALISPRAAVTSAGWRRRGKKLSTRRRKAATSRKPVIHSTDLGKQPGADLPASRQVSFKGSFSLKSPKRAYTREGNSSPTPQPARTISVQRAAAVLAAEIPSIRNSIGAAPADPRRLLRMPEDPNPEKITINEQRPPRFVESAASTKPDQVHIGAICDALIAANIDTDFWTGKRLISRLNHHAQHSGWAWPDTLSNPGRFLLRRLRQLELPDPASAAPRAVEVLETEPQKTPSTPESIAAIRAQFGVARTK